MTAAVTGSVRMRLQLIAQERFSNMLWCLIQFQLLQTSKHLCLCIWFNGEHGRSSLIGGLSYGSVGHVVRRQVRTVSLFYRWCPFDWVTR